MHQVAELVEIRHHVAVLQQPRIVSHRLQGSCRSAPPQAAPARAPRSRSARQRTTCPCPRAGACPGRTGPPLVRDQSHRKPTPCVPGWRRRAPKLDLEQPRGRLQNPRLHLRIGEIGPNRLRVKIKRRPPELLIPVSPAGNVDRLQPRLPLPGKPENQFMLPPRPLRGWLRSASPETSAHSLPTPSSGPQ